MASAMTTDMDPEKSIEELANKKNQAAKELHFLKKYDKALILYSELIELCPDNAIYYGNRAACYMMLGKYRDALTNAKKSMQLDPKLFKAYVRVIKCCLILGDIIEAESTLSKLIELDPENEGIAEEKRSLQIVQKFIKDAEAAYAAKDYRKVVYCMDRCCDISTYCKRFKLTKAECLAFLGRYEEAQKIVNDILHFDEQNVDAMYILAVCLYFLDYTNKALAYFQQVFRLAPDHAKALEIYKKAKALKKKRDEGNAAFMKDKYQEAYKLFSEAMTIDPQNILTNAKLHFNNGIAAARLGRLNLAILEYTKALKLNGNYVPSLLRRAACYMELEEYEKAVADYEEACKMEKSRQNRRYLMEAKLALKKTKRKDYYKILGIDKNASTDDIRKAYKKRALVHHPDRHPNATDGEKREQEKKFKEVGEAYGILSDPKKRSRYDSGHDIYDTEDYDGGFSDMDPAAAFQTFFNNCGSYQFQTSDFTDSFTFQFS